MLKCFSVLLIQLSAFTIHAQQSINIELKKELDSIYILDQQLREFFYKPVNADSMAQLYHVPKSELMNYLNKKMVETDSSNMKRIEAIIKQYGYPGKALVGTPTNEVAFFVLQHSNKINTYIPLVKRAALSGELPFKLYAMMLDRQLMNEGKEQIYGTQGQGRSVKNPQTGKQEFKMFIWPIKDPLHVNERRRKAGFDQSVEENAKGLGIDYKVLTLDEVKKMQ